MPRSSFFHAMTCFFTTDPNSNPSNRRAPVPKNKSKRNTDILISGNVLSSQIPLNPKLNCRPQINTAKPKTSKEVIDLTAEEDDPVQPIKIQILDKTLNMAPILIHMKTDSLGNTNTFNPSQCFSSSDKPCLKTEKTSENDVEILSLKEETIEVNDDSMSIDHMSVEKQTNPYKNDVPMLGQSDNYNAELSTDENRETHCKNNQVCELKKVPIFEKSGNDFTEEKRKSDEEPASCKSRKKSSVKPKKRNKREQFHALKIASLSESNTYFCFLCEVSLKDKLSVNVHIQNDKYAKPGYKCSLCDQRFQWKAFLTRHLRQHFGTSDLESTMKFEQTADDVSIKSASIPDLPGLNQITEDVHETFNNLEQQLKSNNNSTHSALIKIISDTDRKDINLACGYCDQCFSSQISLVEHCRTHMDGRPFICNICGTLFKNNAALVYHTRSHFNMIRSRRKKTSAAFIRYVLRLHSCNDCDRSYISWSALNQHILNCHSATAERFLCDTCNQVFYTIGSLRSHKHRNICKRTKMRFTCEVCGKTYCNKQLLRKHELKIHPNVFMN